MNLRFIKTEIFAFIFLFFVSFAKIDAQVNSSIYQLQAGTLIHVQMDNEINSKVASVNDTFTATLDNPVIVRERVILPKGTIIEGRVTKVKRATYGSRNGTMEVSFQTLRLTNGARQAIEGILVTKLETESSQTKNVLTIVGGTALGGIVGAVSKVENGGLIGAGVGAGVGTSIAFLKKGKDVGLKTDAKFEIRLIKDVTLPVEDF